MTVVLGLLPLVELYGAWLLFAIGVVLMWSRRAGR